MFTLVFWKQVAERAVKTFLQSYLAVFLVGDVGFNVFTWTWNGPELGIALGATILSVVTSLLSASMNDPSSPSAVSTVVPGTLTIRP
jgi:hypothetical protein